MVAKVDNFICGCGRRLKTLSGLVNHNKACPQVVTRAVAPPPVVTRRVVSPPVVSPIRVRVRGPIVLKVQKLINLGLGLWLGLGLGLKRRLLPPNLRDETQPESDMR